VSVDLTAYLEPTYTVYRLYDAENNLLYVGATSDIPKRFAEHRRDKAWWPEVVRAEGLIHNTPEEAAYCEEGSIVLCQPRYNTKVAHRRYRGAGEDATLLDWFVESALVQVEWTERNP
jgi:hypothetical protein